MQGLGTHPQTPGPGHPRLGLLQGDPGACRSSTKLRAGRDSVARMETVMLELDRDEVANAGRSSELSGSAAAL